MPITTLDPWTALIVIDLQKGIAGYPTVHPLDDVVEKTNSLSTAFRNAGLPVVLVVAAGGSPGRTDQPRRGHDNPPPEALELVPNLLTEPGDIRIQKHARGAFSNTGLEARLRRLGVTQVVVVGVATSNGVESTARQAYEAGFNVTLPVDAMTDIAAENHEHSVSRVFPRLAETGTTQDVLSQLAQRSV